MKAINLLNLSYNLGFIVAKSPVFSHITATLSGLSTIRAHQAQKFLGQEFDNRQDLDTGTHFMLIGEHFAVLSSMEIEFTFAQVVSVCYKVIFFSSKIQIQVRRLDLVCH